MPLSSIRRRLTQVKHRRTVSSDSGTSDDSAASSVDSVSTSSLSNSSISSSRHMSYIPHSRSAARNKTMSISGPIAMTGAPRRADIPPMPTRSLTISASSGAPPRPPRFTRPRAAPLPPPAAAAAAANASRPVSHAPPKRAASTPPPPPMSPPPVPPRAMPPWRASLIGLAETYAPLGTPSPEFGGAGHTQLMTCLQDPQYTELEALAALRSYIDRVHATHRHHSLSNFPSDVSEADDEDFGLAI